MTYIEKYADIKFKLPDLPHLPPEMHADYYKVLKLFWVKLTPDKAEEDDGRTREKETRTWVRQ